MNWMRNEPPKFHPVQNRPVLDRRIAVPNLMEGESRQRREFLISTSLGGIGAVTGVIGAVAGVGSIAVGLEAARQAREDSHASLRKLPLLDVRGEFQQKLLLKLFPFLRAGGREASFYPAPDNKRLQKFGFTHASVSLASHLALSSPQRPVIDSLAISRKGFGPANRPPLDVFSLMTLAESELMRAAVGGRSAASSTWEDLRIVRPRTFVHDRANVVFGSPNSNSVSAELRGKIRYTEPGREQELKHYGVPGLHLSFEFACDATADPSLYDQAKGRYAWYVYKHDRTGGSPKRLPGDSWLVLSVIPNHAAGLAAMSDLDRRVLLVEGSSAIGTSAAHLIWTSQPYLRQLADRLHKAKNPPYWQAVYAVPEFREIEIYASLKNPERQYIATGIELIDFEPVRPSAPELSAHIRLAARVLRDGRDELMRGGKPR